MKVPSAPFFYFNMENAILTTAYFGSIQYYTKFLMCDNVVIEQYDSYHKQTYRNRCQILGANGPLDLTIPVVKKSGQKMLVNDVIIDDSQLWQNNHWRSLFSAYNSSPFFEYYEEELRPIFQKKWKFLLDFNVVLHELIVELLELETAIQLTTEYNKIFDGMDFREVIVPNPKPGIIDTSFQAYEYTQTFADKFGFVPNLSILDLLFNVGPESFVVLEKSIIQ